MGIQLKEIKVQEVDSWTISRIVQEYGDKASWQRDSIAPTPCTVMGPWPCSEDEVARFEESLNRGDQTAELIISNINWDDEGGRVFPGCGDRLFPVVLKAVKLNRDTYLFMLEGENIFREFRCRLPHEKP